MPGLGNPGFRFRQRTRFYRTSSADVAEGQGTLATTKSIVGHNEFMGRRKAICTRRYRPSVSWPEVATRIHCQNHGELSASSVCPKFARLPFEVATRIHCRYHGELSPLEVAARFHYVSLHLLASDGTTLVLVRKQLTFGPAHISSNPVELPVHPRTNAEAFSTG